MPWFSAAMRLRFSTVARFSPNQRARIVGEALQAGMLHCQNAGLVQSGRLSVMRRPSPRGRYRLVTRGVALVSRAAPAADAGVAVAVGACHGLTRRSPGL